MKRTRKILVALITMLMVISIATSAFAETVTFGIEEYRRPTADGKQYAYKINRGGSNGKMVWKVVVRENSGTTINYDNTIYCLKAERGFYTDTPGEYTADYDKMIDFSDKSQLVPSIIENDDYYYAIMWILDHAYIPYFA